MGSVISSESNRVGRWSGSRKAPGKVKGRIALCLLVVLLLCSLSNDILGASSDDHLVPVKGGFWAEYRKIWEPKLLVTPVDVAGFVLLPNGSGVETAVAIYQQRGHGRAVSGDYFITRTEASRLLADFIAVGRDHADAQKVHVKRWDASLPKSTAELLHKLWLTMLLRTAPETDSQITVVDSTKEIYFARNSEGVLLEAESPNHLGENTTALGKLALLLIDYPVSSEPERARLAKQIGKDTERLLERVARSIQRGKRAR